MLEVDFMTFDQTLAKTERTTPTCVLRVYHLACTSCADTQSCHPLFFVSRLSNQEAIKKDPWARLKGNNGKEQGPLLQTLVQTSETEGFGGRGRGKV